MNDERMYYRGRPIEDLTRDELLDAVRVLGKQSLRTAKRHREDLEMLRSLRW